MKEIKLSKETTKLVAEIDELLTVDLRDYEPTHVCKLGINPFNIKDLEKIYDREASKALEKDPNFKKEDFKLSSEMKSLWSELNDDRNDMNLLILSGLVFYRGMHLNPFGVLSVNVLLKVSKEILVAYNEVFKDTDFMDVFKSYTRAANKMLASEEEAFVNFMLEVVKESLERLKK